MASDNLKRNEFTIRRRVECEEIAFHVVNKLVDGCADDQYLSECGKRISQANYDDIVEERAIIKLCGYPLCDQNLPNVPKKKYHISTKANKVYDISERKKFCSNQCFKASNAFKQQIPESPVWGRNKEKIDIVISPHKGVHGQVGEEVIGEIPKHNLLSEVEKLEELDKRFGEKRKDPKEESILQENDNRKETSVIQNEEEDFANNNACSSERDKPVTCDMEDNSIVEDLQSGLEKFHLGSSESDQIKSSKMRGMKSTAETKESCKASISGSVKVTNVENSGEKQAQPSSKLEQLQKLLNKRKNVLSGMVDLQQSTENKVNKDDLHHCSDSREKDSEKKTLKIEKPNSGKKRDKKKGAQPSNVQSPLYLICQVLKQWMSVSTVEYLQFKALNSDLVDHAANQFSDLQIQVDCVNLSKNLDIREKELASVLGDDASNLVEDGEGRKEMKNVPDYNVLQGEAEQFQLKVTEFITGKKPKQDTKEKDGDSEGVVYIPTVDTFDQSQIRAKIVLERLDKSLPDVLIPMGLSIQDVSTRIRELIYTFRLERDTIVFKPAEWTLVSLLLLKMLSFRVKAVEEALNKNSTIRHFSILLKGLNHTLEDIDLFAREILSAATVTFEPS